ncbi:glycoside hydrolase family 3 protein [Pseudonocardiaceae bacterium YIM PH 21723]|nr:glycoside hydrolase family 3 protein [Pseudonocardiaceae bacterium YIM PH 21723]
MSAWGRATTLVLAAGLALSGCGVIGTARADRMNSWVTATAAKMSLPEKVGQLFVTRVFGPGADTADPRNREMAGVDTPAEVVRRYHVGGVCIFANTGNVQNPPQLARLTNGLQQAVGAGPGLLVSADQEQGLVVRIGPPATQFPGNMALAAAVLGADDDDTAVRDSATITAQEMKALGVNQNYAPDADVNVNPANPVIGVRSFSSDPELTARLTATAVEGLQDASVSATAKHFPGHGDTTVDSHTGLPVINHSPEEWERLDAPPFRAAIDAEVDTIMSAHIVMPKLDTSGEPATLAPKLLTGLLRDELGYRGVIITDSLGMEGVRAKHPDDQIPVLALQAGADMLLTPPKLDVAINGVLDAVRRGVLTEKRIDQSLRRVLELKWRRGMLTPQQVDLAKIPQVVGTREHLATAKRISTDAITVLGGQLPWRSGKSTLIVAAKQEQLDAAAEVVRTYGPTETMVAGTDLDAVLAKAKQFDRTILLAGRAHEELAKKLATLDKPVAGVAVAEPYVAKVKLPVWLASYSTNPDSVRAAMNVLFGAAPGKGRLPVEIPGSGR